MDNPYRVGKAIYFRPLDAHTDAAVSLPWFNDPEVTRYTTRYLPTTLSEHADFLRGIEGKTNSVVVAVVRREDDRLIGMGSLFEISWQNRHTLFGIVIGEKSDQDKGHGSEASRMMLDLAFQTLNLNRVCLHVYEFNDRARHVYEKLGFKLEGRMRQDYYWQGRYYDTLVMGLLRDEWLSLNTTTVPAL